MPDNCCSRTAAPAFHVFSDVFEAAICLISIVQPVRRNTPCLPASNALRINGIACLNIGQPNGIARAEDNAIIRHAWSNAGTLIESPSDLTSRPRVFSNRLYSGLCTAEWARDRAPVLHCGVLLRAVWRPSAQALHSTGWAGSGPSLRFAPMTAVRDKPHFGRNRRGCRFRPKDEAARAAMALVVGVAVCPERCAF
jgi:hypothetical protein